jgi:hypothetical protein
MNKLSAEDQRQVLAEVPGTLLKLAAERDMYRSMVLENASRKRIEKIAGVMLEKGIREGKLTEVADELEKSASAGAVNLDAIEQAVELVGTDMGKHASVSDGFSTTTGGSDLEQFLLG